MRWGIFGLNLLTEEEFSILGTEEEFSVFSWFPALYGDIVVWDDEEEPNSNIYGYNLTTGQLFHVMTNEGSQHSPAIYGDIIVWEDDRNGNLDIYGCSLETVEYIQTEDEGDEGGFCSGTIFVLCVFLVLTYSSRKYNSTIL